MRPYFLPSNHLHTVNTPALYEAHDAEADLFGWGSPLFTPDILAQGSGSTSTDIQLQGVNGCHQVDVSAAFYGQIDLAAFDLSGAAVATVLSTAAATMSTVNGLSHGSETAGLSIEVQAYLPSDHAVVDVLISDTLALSLSASGFADGGTATTHNTAQEFVQVAAPSGSAHCVPFNLGAFVTTILNSEQVTLDFDHLVKGESVHVTGQSLLTITASLNYLAGGLGSAVSSVTSYHQSAPLAIDVSRTGTGHY